jgi:catabolite regulation protein CreA
LLFRKWQFGFSSEKADEEVMEHFSLLFDEVEVYAYAQQKEGTSAVKAHTRKMHSGSVRDIISKDISVEKIVHELPRIGGKVSPSVAKPWLSSAQRFMKD